MSGNNQVVLDTNVIILISKGQIDTEKLLGRYDSFFASIITYMELYGYDFPNESEKIVIDQFFSIVEVIDLNMPIAEIVVQYRKLGRRIKLPDAVILATAKYIGADLLSDDWDDFIHIDRSIVVSDLSALKIVR